MAYQIFQHECYYFIPGFATNDNLKEVQIINKQDYKKSIGIESNLCYMRLGDDVNQLEFLRMVDGNYRCMKAIVNGTELVSFDTMPLEKKAIEDVAFAVYDNYELRDELDIMPGTIKNRVYTPSEVQIMVARLTRNPNLISARTRDVFVYETFNWVSHKTYVGAIKKRAENGEWERGMIFDAGAVGRIFVFPKGSSCKIEWRFANLRLDKDFVSAMALNYDGRDGGTAAKVKLQLIRSIIEEKPQVDDDEENENFIKNYLAQEHSFEEVMQLIDRLNA